MNFKEFLSKNIVILDGGMGTLLQEKGLKNGEKPEEWNLTHPEIITQIHKEYYDSGSNVVSVNTFGANILKFGEKKLEDIISAAVYNAKNARALSKSEKEKYIALDIGPTGKLLKPYGDLDFEDAVEIFAKTVRLGVKYGVDLIVIETMNDSFETKAALLAAKENSVLPVIVTNAYGADGRLLTGASPAAMVALLEGMGADALGANCSLGPKQLTLVAEELIKYASVPVVLKPNAGLPAVVNGKTVFDVDAEEFSAILADLVKKGVRVAGGCCGTTPEYIGSLAEKTASLSPVPATEKDITLVSSYRQAVCFGDTPVLIGERINPTGKKRFKQALAERDMDYILSEGVSQAEKGVHVLDVNVGLPEIDETEMLSSAVQALQAVTDLPLQIDTASPQAMEKALRLYNGKAMVNSVNGKKESMDAVFPLVKKYGGLVVALTLDEKGIPETADGRVEIAKKILDTAKEYGISKKNIIFDPLALTVSADKNSPSVTLEAVRRIKTELGCHTSLGVSNVSFGLPGRDGINSVFFSLALENGLSAAIMNPYSADMMRVFYAYKALMGMDDNCAEYISVADTFSSLTVSSPASQSTVKADSELKEAIIKGFKDKAAALTDTLLKTQKPLDVVNNEIIPALDMVGASYEKGVVYLPQLLMSAEAAKSSFVRIKAAMSAFGGGKSKGNFVLATVHGDIHDIGKNIVKLLLENYGFNVIDLGKDVPAEDIVKAVEEYRAPLAGLSALMTTTVPAMEETIKLLREKTPWCKIVVGGAVLTEEYAASIGADKYASDAMETVRYGESVINGK